MAKIKKQKLKKFLTWVTVTKRIQKTVYAPTKRSAVKLLKDQFKSKPPRFVGADFVEQLCDASEIETIYDEPHF